MSTIDKNYPLTKDLIKSAFSISFVQKNLMEFFDIHKWFDVLKLKTSDKNLQLFTKVQKKGQWTEEDLQISFSIFNQAFLKNIDNIELSDDFLLDIADGICECFLNYQHRNTFMQNFDSILAGIQPTDPFGFAFGAKKFFCYAAYNDEVVYPYTYYFSNSKKVVEDIGNESYVFERSLLSEEEWKEYYFPDEDLDEVFGFSLDDEDKK